MNTLFQLAEKFEDVPNYNPKESTVTINSDTSRISFTNFKDTLQRKFFNFCSPVLLRDLFRSSKAMKKIRCPVTYVSYCTEIRSKDPEIRSRKPDPSAVIEIRGDLRVADLESGEISKYFDDYKFHHTKLHLEESVLNPEESKVIASPDVTEAKLFDPYFSNKHTLQKFLEMMPYLTNLEYSSYYEISNIGKILFHWNQKVRLEKIKLFCPVHSINGFLTNPEALAKFICHQKRDFKMEVICPTFFDGSLNLEIRKYLWELLKLNDLENRAVFITGCDSGFGRALALKLAKNGLPVFAGCLTNGGAKSLEQETAGSGNQIKTVLVDVRSDESVFAAAKFVKENLKPSQKLWAIVNNAGIAHFQGPDAWTSMTAYQDTIEINTLGIVRGVHAFLPLLKQSKGRIVTVTSMLGRVPMPGLTAYSVSKFGAEAYMDCIRRELKPFGITCSILEPGFFKTAVIPVEKLKAQVDKAWNNLDEKNKLDYGEKFKEKIIEIYTWHHENSAPIDWVVNDYYHAITARFPRLRYRSGWECLFSYIPSTFLPTELGDYVMSKILISNVPAVLKKNKKSE